MSIYALRLDDLLRIVQTGVELDFGGYRRLILLDPIPKAVIQDIPVCPRSSDQVFLDVLAVARDPAALRAWLLVAISLARDLDDRGVFESALAKLFDAQVSSDGDMIPVEIWRSRPSDAKGSTQQGTGVVWTLSTKTDTLATLVVTGRDAGELDAETEYQIFRRDLGDRLAAAHMRRQALYFRRAEGAPIPFVVDDTAPDTFLREVPRRFRVDTQPTRLTSDPKNHQYLYHIESRSRVDGARVDHFLLIRFTRVDLTFEWYADLRPASAKHLGLSLDATDRRWAVEPAGNDPGRLTPIAEAVGHRLIPIATADE